MRDRACFIFRPVFDFYQVSDPPIIGRCLLFFLSDRFNAFCHYRKKDK